MKSQYGQIVDNDTLHWTFLYKRNISRFKIKKKSENWQIVGLKKCSRLELDGEEVYFLQLRGGVK